MPRTIILNRLALSIIVLAVVNFFATHFSWYSLLWWFDMSMHFLGGGVVFYLSAYVWAPALRCVPAWRFLYESLITALLLGLLWEALELFLYIHYGTPDFILLDSLSDVCFDIAGALLAAYLTIPHLFASHSVQSNASHVVS